MTVVLDACAIIAYLRDEEGADLVESALIENKCIVHALNLGEVYKDCLARGENRQTADQLLLELAMIGLDVKEDLDQAFWKNAAELKAQIRKVSYADCFALATTERFNGILYSSDHHEFDPLAENGRFRIKFIR